jgi:PAS domain S-box-containing protein
VGLCVSLAFWAGDRERDRERLEAVRQLQADGASERIQDRLTGLSRVLRGAADFLSRGKLPDRLEWRRYVRDLELQRDAPGVLGLTFTPWVRTQDRGAFETAVRAQGFQSYRIMPGGTLPPDPEGCGPILYVEPSDAQGELAFGRDLWAEPTRREILVRARDTGLPALSAPIALYRGTARGPRAGLLFCTPVFQGIQPPETVAERRRALRGWVCCPIQLADWMRGVLGERLARVRVRLEDRADGPAPIFDSEDAPWSPALAATGRPIRQGGRVWELRAQPTPGELAMMGVDWHWKGLATGVLVSACLAWLISSLAGSWAGSDPNPPERQGPGEAFSLDVAALRPGYAQGAGPGAPEDRARWFHPSAGPGSAPAGGLVQALWETEDRFRMVTEGVKDYLGIIDGSDRVIFRNRVPAGMAMADAIGAPFTQGLEPEFAIRAQSALEACRWTGQETVARGPGRRLDGSPGWFELHLLPVPGADPTEVVLAQALDRTEAKLAESALRESEARLRAVVEQCEDAVFIHDLEGEFLFCNEAACRSTGYSREELLDMGVRDLASSFRPDSRGPVWYRLKAGQQITFPERHRRKDGSSFPVEIRLSLLGLGESRTVLAVARET